MAELAAGSCDPEAVKNWIPELLRKADFSARTLSDLNDRAFRGYADRALADDQLTEDEEQQLLGVGSLLGVDQEALSGRYGDVLGRLVVARVNDGRLGIVEEPTILRSDGEVVHAETPAAMLEAVKTKESVGGGYHGLSIPLGKGFRYHVGGARGRVSTRTEIQATDSGILSVTSARVLFTGDRTTLEIPYPRLVRLQVFDDAIQFHMTGRKSAPLIQMISVDSIAATIGAAKSRGS